MLRRLHILDWPFFGRSRWASSPVPAQPVIDEFVSGAQVFAKKDCALLVVKFNVRLRYASHFPSDKGDELRISLHMIDRPAPGLTRLSRREGVRVDNAKLAGIRTVTVDLDQSIATRIADSIRPSSRLFGHSKQKLRKHSGRDFAKGLAGVMQVAGR